MPTAGYGVLWERAATPLLPARGSGERCKLPAGFGDEPQPSKCFLLFSFPALRMTSPDTIILLVVDYDVAIGTTAPLPPLRTPLPGLGLTTGRDPIGDRKVFV